jgi:hypothetical protein
MANIQYEDIAVSHETTSTAMQQKRPLPNGEAAAAMVAARDRLPDDGYPDRAGNSY